MGDKTRGLFKKFTVARVDGSDTSGGKHEGCEYFVLDLTHDEHVARALRAYSKAVRADGYELLANDLDAKADKIKVRRPNNRTTQRHNDGIRGVDADVWLAARRGK